MIENYLNQSAYKIVKGNYTLFSGTSASSLVITSTAPSIPFRLKITASGTDCAGTITVNGSETLTYVIAGTKTTTTVLSALPTITTANLDCTITITCLDAAGAPIQGETLTPIMIRLEAYQSGFWNAEGTWTKADDQVFCKTLMSVGDIIRCNSIDHTIVKVEDNPNLGGISEFYTYLVR
jgi:hypothetical protein